MDVRTWTCEGRVCHRYISVWRGVVCDMQYMVVGQPTASARWLSIRFGADGVLRQ